MREQTKWRKRERLREREKHSNKYGPFDHFCAEFKSNTGPAPLDEATCFTCHRYIAVNPNIFPRIGIYLLDPDTFSHFQIAFSCCFGCFGCCCCSAYWGYLLFCYRSVCVCGGCDFSFIINECIRHCRDRAQNWCKIIFIITLIFNRKFIMVVENVDVFVLKNTGQNRSLNKRHGRPNERTNG